MIRRLAALVVSLAVRGFDLARRAVWPRRSTNAPRTGVVLYYHDLKRRDRARFARQMDELVKRTRPFAAGSPEQMTDGTQNAAVTFDDGFRSVVENAVPELARRGIPFTVFVPSGCLGQRPSWVRDPEHPSWDERVLSAADLRALSRVPLASLGSHSITHRDLRRLDAADAERELVESKAALQAAAGVTIDLFSFPHGAHDARLLEQARRAGYRRVFTIEPETVRAGAAAFTVGRVAASPGDWLIEFRLKLAGAYRWRQSYHRLRHMA
ncbi:MAG TPA: polysaccharide deacetylase family protein [Vicinamibacterales bacterium]|nr:polysaccharide deacetylase family protein [Vicinamibacterales bacterium]